jgi:CheY-like chemotaxis protein
LRALGRKLTPAADEVTRQGLLVDGFLRINSLVANTSGELRHPAHQMLVALEGLFRKLLESAKNSSASTLATIADAFDLLPDLCAPGLKTTGQSPVELLVVDDDLVARRVLAGALQTIFSRPESVESGEAALALAAVKTYDVIFLDVIMPGMDGFETCLKIRGTIPNRTTPVIFVTSQNDASAREQMNRNGGNDILGKPFLTSEITVKALTFALRGRLKQFTPPPVAG